MNEAGLVVPSVKTWVSQEYKEQCLENYSFSGFELYLNSGTMVIESHSISSGITMLNPQAESMIFGDFYNVYVLCKELGEYIW